MKKQIRWAIGTIIIILGVVPLLNCLHAKTVSQQTKPSILFVQTTETGSLMPSKKVPGLYELTFKGVNPSTVYFTDRPRRDVGHQATIEFIQDWSTGPKSFATVPPNAALEILDTRLGNITLIVELLSPHISSNGKTLTYEVRILNAPAISSNFIEGKLTGDTGGKPPAGAIGKFGIAALFIDSAEELDSHCQSVKNTVVPAKNPQWSADVRTCSSNSWGKKEATTKCLQGKYPNLPSTCLDCYGSMAACARSKCWSHCMFDSTSHDCLKCAVNKCEDPSSGKGFSLERCTGLTLEELGTNK